ncbi:MAG: hypothetical protein ACRDXF_07895, partial [Acidimicrobiia bacterium]
HPGVPATIVVEEGQTEVFLEGESLGRWSLFDVRAARLVSSAFSLSLDGEEITFIADEPVDFAYKGVDHMAGVWARYKSMTIPRRVVAVGRSRRGTIPSRIPELRDAMLLNLQTAGRGASRPASMEVTTAPAVPSPWTKRIDAYSNVPEPIDTDQVNADQTDTSLLAPDPTFSEPIAPSEQEADELESAEPGDVPGTEPDLEPVRIEVEDVSPIAPEVEPALAATDIEETTAVEDAKTGLPRSPLRPGPGLIPRRVERTPARDEAEPFWDEAWQEPPVEDERFDDLPPDADMVFGDDEPQVVVAEEAEGPVTETEEDPSEGDAIFADAIFAEEIPQTSELPHPIAEATSDDDAVAPSIEDWMEAGEAEEVTRREMVVDLDHLHVDEPTSLEPDLELLFAGAPAPEGEKSGLLGAVRSAFARNKTAHEHEFVEAPGGIGIVRQICADCGYISIGVAD